MPVNQMVTPSKKITLGSKGLNEDLPPYMLSPDFFNSGLNMRFKDGSIEAVPQSSLFMNGTDVFLPTTTSTSDFNVVSFTKYIPYGSRFLDLVYVGITSTNLGSIRIGTTSTNTSPTKVSYIPLPQSYTFTYDYTYGIDNFVFNGLSLVNPKTNQPIWYDANNSSSTGYDFLPNWIFTTASQIPTIQVSGVSGDKKTIVFSASVSSYVATGDLIGRGNWSTTSTVKSFVVTNLNSGGTTAVFPTATDFVVGDYIWVGYPYNARYMTTFQGRLFAMNLKRTQPNPSQPEYSPIEFAWSNPLSELESLADMVWTASSTNSAGNLYMTESPGEILAAVPLGEYFVVYKTDQIYKIYNAGAPYYYLSQPLYTDDGIISGKAVIEINQSKHLFVGNNGIWLHQGGIDKQNISRGRIEEAFYRGSEGIDFSYANETFCYHNVLEKEVWICFRSKRAFTPSSIANGSVLGCDRAYVYNYVTDTWYKRSLGQEYTDSNGNVIAANYPTQIEDVIANNVSFTVVAAPTTNYSTTYTPAGMWYIPHVTPTSTGIFEPNGYMQLDSRDVGTASSVKNVNGIYPHANQPVDFKLKFTDSINPQDFSTVLTRRFDPTTVQNKGYRLDFRETGRYMHLKAMVTGAYSDSSISPSNPTVNPRLTDIDIDSEVRGRR